MIEKVSQYSRKRCLDTQVNSWLQRQWTVGVRKKVVVEQSTAKCGQAAQQWDQSRIKVDQVRTYVEKVKTFRSLFRKAALEAFKKKVKEGMYCLQKTVFEVVG